MYADLLSKVKTVALNTVSGLYLVRCVVRARVLCLHQDIRMQEVGGDHVWNKGCRVFLEDCSHDVISYVSFPLQLRRQIKKKKKKDI